MGIFNWAKTKTSNLKNAGKKIVGVEDIKKNSSFIKDMSKVLVSPQSAIKNGKKETFLEAKSRLNVTELDIIQNYRNMVYGFYISFVFATICFLGALYNLFLQKNILGALSMLAVLLICLANSFRFSFRAFQIKHQKLCSPKEWWDRSNEWFPTLP